jgi:hypothetical protein
MDKDIATALGRLDRYIDRIKKSLRKGELIIALADTAELHEISRRLYLSLEQRIKLQVRKD